MQRLLKVDQMNSNIPQTLRSEVAAIQDGQWSSSQVTANFFLKDRQGFYAIISRAGYLFMPIEGYNQVPDIKKIYWQNKGNRGFSGYGALRTNITFSATCTGEDKKIYQQILTPYAIDEGRLVLFPDYSCVPLLKSAISLEYHWVTALKMSKAKIQAEQNLQDFMAMRRQTYDLRQYGC